MVNWSWFNNPSVDGLIALPTGSNVELEDVMSRHYRDNELAFRKQFASPKPTWHWKQAEAFEREGNIYAELFHRAWLLKLAPTNASLHDDLHSVHEDLQVASTDKSVRLSKFVSDVLKISKGTALKDESNGTEMLPQGNP